LALDPIGYAQKIYKKINLNFTEQILDELKKTLATKNDFKPHQVAVNYATGRDFGKNEIINRWRLILEL